MASQLLFAPAVKRQLRLRMGLCGPAGSGKTYSALAIAQGLGGKIAVMDTERGSARLYADLFKFDVCELTSFDPLTVPEAIRTVENAGYNVLLIDSLSHFWMGKDGALEMVDTFSAREKGNKFAAWRHVTPAHNRMIDSILQSKCHIICTMRTKTEWVVEQDGRGKSVPRRVGLAPVQRDGMEYEFTVVGDLDLDHKLIITKTRCNLLTDQMIDRPGEDLGKQLNAWLNSGEVAPEPPIPSPPAQPAGSGNGHGPAVTTPPAPQRIAKPEVLNVPPEGDNGEGDWTAGPDVWLAKPLARAIKKGVNRDNGKEWTKFGFKLAVGTGEEIHWAATFSATMDLALRWALQEKLPALVLLSQHGEFTNIDAVKVGSRERPVDKPEPVAANVAEDDLPF